MLRERDDIRCKLVWDHDAVRGRKVADELKATFVADVNDIYRDPAVNGVVVLSEINRHEALVLPAVQAKKNIFVEKPLGMAATDAYRMADAIRSAGVIFQTGYFNRSEATYRFIRDEAQKGNLGKVWRIEGSNCHHGAIDGWFDKEWRWMTDRTQAGCGAFGDLGTHLLDIMIWIAGDVATATAQVDKGSARYGDCDETGQGLLRFANGAIGTLQAGWLDLANPQTLRVSGTEGHAVVINGELFYKSRKVAGADGEKPWTNLPPKFRHALHLWFDAIAGKKDAMLVDAHEAAYRNAVIEAMYEGAASGKFVTVKKA